MIKYYDRNAIIDECILQIESLIRPHCSDHTPYRGPCVSCGNSRNYDELPDPETVIESLKSLKAE